MASWGRNVSVNGSCNHGCCNHVKHYKNSSSNITTSTCSCRRPTSFCKRRIWWISKLHAAKGWKQSNSIQFSTGITGKRSPRLHQRTIHFQIFNTLVCEYSRKYSIVVCMAKKVHSIPTSMAHSNEHLVCRGWTIDWRKSTLTRLGSNALD